MSTRINSEDEHRLLEDAPPNARRQFVLRLNRNAARALHEFCKQRGISPSQGLELIVAQRLCKPLERPPG